MKGEKGKLLFIWKRQNEETDFIELYFSDVKTI